MSVTESISVTQTNIKGLTYERSFTRLTGRAIVRGDRAPAISGQHAATSPHQSTTMALFCQAAEYRRISLVEATAAIKDKENA